MPTNHVISTANSINVTGRNGLEMADGDTLWLDDGGSIRVGDTTHYGVNVAAGNVRMNIDGIVDAYLGALQFFGTTSATINIGRTGKLNSASPISGTIEFGATAGLLIINNYGSIAMTGTGAAIATTGVLQLFNAGLITGAANLTAIYGSDRDDIINNAGRIQGHIEFGLGNDIYYGAGGTVEGTVRMGAGNDRFYGGTADESVDLGAGDDFVDGGAGLDTLVVSNLGPVTINLALTGPQDTGQGIKTIVNVENVTGFNANDTLIGNGEANRLDGRDGNDTLDGGGGNDTLVAGYGDDSLIGGDGYDIVVFDGARSAVYANMANSTDANNTFGADVYVGIEALQGSQYADHFIGDAAGTAFFGMAGDDQLEGGAGDDTLDGGAGADRLYGNAGNDTFFVDQADTVIEAANEGIDTIIAGFSYALGSHLENLVVTGEGAFTLTGNTLDNTLTGNAGANTLTGGAGNDVLTGGAGRDTFVFDAALNKRTNLDRIVDFNVKDDTIWLDNKYMPKLGKGTIAKPGKLDKKAFWIGSAAHDADDRIIYDSKKGLVYYDADGTGRIKPVEIMKIAKGLKMTAADFFII
ncbi:calcium-binding protein [Microvirga flavescens]|uniref:calcium-binding protein n=1 Tax=Microvirga flavescens TaxID=2249811 RepID=UPI000DD7DBF4|nr:calcium-binding protein [Microvirga flavescens]